MWAQSAELNEHDGAHPIVASTLRAVETRRTTTCQHALFMLRWLGRSPESFIPAVEDHPRFTLPAATSAQRLRWNLSALSTALDQRRRANELTWKELSSLLSLNPSQLTGLRRVKYAIDMVVAMRIVSWLNVPAADFVYAARW